MKHIVVYKGGGAKGLIQASCMAELSANGIVDFSNQDLHVGASVGAINAAAICCGMPPDRLLKQYPNMLDMIFDRSWLPTLPKYDRDNFLKAWTTFFEKTKRMSEVRSKLIITSVDRCTQKPHFFKSWENKDGKEYLINVICRSFAAPYYFGQINDPVNQKVWIDGGCGIDNLPLEYAYVEAILQGWLSEPITIVALGTGYTKLEKPYKEVANDKTLSQIGDFLNLPNGGLARSMSSWAQIDRLVKLCSVFKNIRFLYYDIAVAKEADGMDKLKYKSEYIAWGKQMARKPLIEVAN